MNKDFFTLDITGELGDLANYKLPDPTLIDYYKRLKNREILINQDIDDWVVEWTQEIIEWNRIDKNEGISIEDRIPIKIFINSNGGSLNAIMELITICNMSITPVYAIGMGNVIPLVDFYLWVFQKEIDLFYQPRKCLFTMGIQVRGGDTGKVLDDLEYTKRTEESTKKFILEHTDISEKEYDKNYRRNWWLMSNEIIKLGIADKIVTNIEDLF